MRKRQANHPNRHQSVSASLPSPPTIRKAMRNDQNKESNGASSSLFRTLAAVAPYKQKGIGTDRYILFRYDHPVPLTASAAKRYT